MRTNELNPHDDGFDSADHEEDESVDNVQDPQSLVIDGRHPLVKHGVYEGTWHYASGGLPCD